MHAVIDIQDNDITSQFINNDNDDTKETELRQSQAVPGQLETAKIESIQERVHALEQKNKENSDEQQQSVTARLDSLTTKMDKLLTNFQNMEQRISDIELRMNEEQKENANNDKIDKLINDMNRMKQEMKRIASHNNVNPEQQKLKAWLEDKVKLPEYYDLFIENGIEDLDTVKILTMEGLKGMGIDKVGHQMKMLSQIVKLNENVVVANEGGTAYIG